ncbi:MAG TPA: MarR family transcriptional regulator [Burkholderiales bacterium]|nr:MarR family transcriptional regulator [Burkholderiales bacterium]
MKKNKGYHPPLTVSRPALLVQGSDMEFRRLISRLVLVMRRLRQIRRHFGWRIGLTGPQYVLLVNVAYLQGAGGVAVTMLARDMRVTSAFVTGESRRLIQRGLLAKHANPKDSRSTLLMLTPAGRRCIDALVPEIRKVNDALFGRVDKASFRFAGRFLDELAAGSADALELIRRAGYG